MLRCITKNILASIYTVDRTDNRYSFVEDISILETSYRMKLLLEQIRGYDLILLQEVELDNKELITSQLLEYDYYSHEISKGRTNVIGNMILWKRSSMNLLKTEANSSTIFCLFVFNDIIFAVGNAHFCAHRDPKTTLNRYNQMKSTLKTLSKFKIDRCILAGDFNDELENDTITRTLIDESDFIIAETKPTCYIWKHHRNEHKFLAVDKVLSTGVMIEIGHIPEVRPIPDKDESSDHFSVPFNILF